MRDIYETAKKAQMAPVRGRVKAMMAQPRAVAQARKVARQTTGFAKGGITDSPTKVINRLLSDEKGKPHSTTEGKEASIKRLTKRVLDRYIKKGQQQGLNPADVRSAIDLVGSSKGSFKDFFEKAKKKQEGGHVKKASHKWTAERFGGGEKGKPHSTQEGRIAAGERLFKRFWNKKREEDEKRRMGPGAPARPKEAGMNVKKGGVMNYKKGGKVDKKWIQKAVNPKHKGYCTPMTKKTCTPARKRLAKLFKSKARKGWSKGGLPYLTRGISRPGVYKAPRGKHHMAELLAGKTSKLKTPKKTAGKKLAAVAGVGAIGAETYRQKTKKKKKSVEESLIEKIKKKANGGTIVMPTVGNDVRTRAYKHGALIHPRPKPTTVAHGRGVGIAKRGW